MAEERALNERAVNLISTRAKGSGDEFFEGVAAIQAALDQTDGTRASGELMDFRSDGATIFKIYGEGSS